ncbi:MAG: hypothetical protein ACRCWD_04730 [Culicoidibacterales bacterium]
MQQNNQDFEAEYGLYRKIVNQQLNKLNIYYNREDYFQEGLLSIVVANRGYDAGKMPNRIAYLTLHVKWKLQSLLRAEGERLTREERYQRWLNDEYQKTSQECYWYGIHDPIIRIIIRDIQLGYTKKELAQRLGVSERSLARRIAKIRQLDHHDHLLH